jgi:peptidyl-dipeptidase A
MDVRRLALAGAVLLVAGVALILLLLRGGDGDGPASRHRVAADLPPPTRGEITQFLDDYNETYQTLWTAAEIARWRAAVDITETTRREATKAAQDLADYVGSRTIIDQLQRLRRADDLTLLQRRQLDQAWQLAAHHPGTAPATVRKLLDLESRQSATLHGHGYVLETGSGETQELSANTIDRILRESRDLDERRRVWELAAGVGPSLRDGVVELRELRNALADRMDYASYFDLACADYGLTATEMMILLDDLVEGMRPLYEQLHCWVRHELADRYGEDRVPELIPAHWLPDRWGAQWPDIVAGVDLDGMVRDVSPQWIIEQGERFYMSLGFSALPLTFWGRSDLYELPPEANRRKHTGASAWHIDLDRDVRALMNVRNEFGWFTTVHRELGEVYYFLSYARPEVPPVLRRGANRAFDVAIGQLASLAGSQVPYLLEVGMLDEAEVPERIRWLLSEALTGAVVSLPFVCGTVAHWEYDLYAGDLPRHKLNERWWQHAAVYQGIVPPSRRGEDFCDPATLPEITENPAAAADRAIGDVIMHQLHRYICRQVLGTDVHEANYRGNTEIGVYLESILAAGATRDWNRLLAEATGEPLSATAMLDYYEPLLAWLERQNEGRQVGWPTP